MLKDIKIAFFDLDGTLTNSNHEISKQNEEALKTLKEKNIKIVFSSGRWDTYVIKYNKGLNLVDYIICNNGAEILDLNNSKIIKGDLFDEEIINNLINYCKQNNLEIIFNGLLKRYTINDIIDGPIYQVVIICNSKEDIQRIVEYTERINTKVTYISSAYYKNIQAKTYTTNINLKDSDKGNGIKYLLNELNIDKQNSICFGDNDNDLTMFNNCGIKVCMANGINSLKENSDYITLSNDEDGVAYFINNYIK